MSQLLDEIVHAQKRGEGRGITSICSAHPWVLKTALRGTQPVLIEATCNQVNQFGGYTGLTPADFVRYITSIAAENGYSPANILLGGDHLGPSPWQDAPIEIAMQKATGLVQAYVQAGFTKIHLDASMKLGGDDPHRPLDPELSARRTALLARTAEETLAKISAPSQGLRYVIGTEVPIPGGATAPEDGFALTSVDAARHTLEITQAAFLETDLASAWERVIALVVQPGVEFGSDFILDYQSEAAQDLRRFSETTPLIYEAHSTDYQTRLNLRSLVRNHFAILKVGPALTYAFRQAVFALAMIENELFPADQCSHLVETLESAMLRQPAHWQKHYHGTERAMALARKYSLSDRARYYWPAPEVQASLVRLLANLTANIPLSLLSQFLPEIPALVRARTLPNSAHAFIHHRIGAVLADYAYACHPSSAA